MAYAVLDKFATPAALTITLASLASSVAGVGRQSGIVDNTTNRYQDILLSLSIKQGTSPTGNKSIQVYLIRDNNDGTPIRDDSAGVADAAITVLSASLVGILINKATPSTGDVLKANFLISRPGPKWGIAIVHDTVAALDATGGNHVVSYIGMNPEIQA